MSLKINLDESTEPTEDEGLHPSQTETRWSNAEFTPNQVSGGLNFILTKLKYKKNS